MVSLRQFLPGSGDRDRRNFWETATASTRNGTGGHHAPLLGRLEGVDSTHPAKEVTNVALRLKHQIEQIIPYELEESKVIKANSPIITNKVIRTAKEAGRMDGKDYSSCVPYCLLVCKRWFKRQASIELWDAGLHNIRALACEIIAKRLIEGEEREDYLMQETLLRRYSIIINGEETVPANVIERAVDLHALWVIGSSGYQKCIRYLWRGWLVQDDMKPGEFVPMKHKTSTHYWDHFHPGRMRAPKYQIAVQISISVLFLSLYTISINTINETGDVDVIEGILYVFTAGFVFDEVAKFWKDDFVTRMIALGHPIGADERSHFNELSYNLLAFSAPMFWMRLLLYLDTFRFFGAMLVVLKVMMKESLIFFALLVVICIGFLQAFIGMNHVEDNRDVMTFVIQAMANSVMQSPDFSGFDDFADPFGLILYYIYTFVVMVILLNILIALYNSAYESVNDNAIDEYMALFAAKTMQFVRAPDENVFIAPFNLIEIFLLILPFEWWLPRERYDRLNYRVMGVIYSPLLLVTAWIETREAHHILKARSRGDTDDDTVEEWEQLGEFGVHGGSADFESDGWAKKVERSKPDVATDAVVLEVRELKGKITELANLVAALSAAKGEPS